MKLTLYRVREGRVEIVGSVIAGEVDNPVLKEFPEVWRGGNKLLPADGERYLEAVHAALYMGSDRWTEMRYLPMEPEEPARVTNRSGSEGQSPRPA